MNSKTDIDSTLTTVRVVTPQSFSHKINEFTHEKESFLEPMPTFRRLIRIRHSESDIADILSQKITS